MTLETSWLGFQPERELIRLQCFGQRGGLLWPDGLLLGETNKSPWTLKVDDLGKEDVYYDEIRDFVQAIEEGLPSPVPVEQTLNVIRILEGLYQSAQTKAEVSLAQQKSPRAVTRGPEIIEVSIPGVDSVPTPLAPLKP